jgi:hypothetical protein
VDINSWAGQVPSHTLIQPLIPEAFPGRIKGGPLDIECVDLTLGTDGLGQAAGIMAIASGGIDDGISRLDDFPQGTVAARVQVPFLLSLAGHSERDRSTSSGRDWFS